MKTFDARGKVTGEHRFLGLWTSTAYHGSPRDIPVLRRKVERVVAAFRPRPASHDGKAVLNVLETYPRDELFQASVDDLIRIARGVVNLYERRTVRLLVRRDPYHRFYSCLVYVPRDRYNTEVRQRIEQIVLEGFEGTRSRASADLGSSHARVHVVVRTDPEQRRKRRLRRHRAAHRGSGPHLDRPAARCAGRARGRGAGLDARAPLPARLSDGLRGGRRAGRRAAGPRRPRGAARSSPQAHAPEPASPDATRKPQRVHLKIVKLGDPVPISDVLPMFEHFGLRVIAERPYELAWPDGGAAWIQDFELEHRERLDIDIAHLEANFKRRLRRRLERRGRERRLQPPAARRRV